MNFRANFLARQFYFVLPELIKISSDSLPLPRVDRANASVPNARSHFTVYGADDTEPRGYRVLPCATDVLPANNGIPIRWPEIYSRNVSQIRAREIRNRQALLANTG